MHRVVELAQTGNLDAHTLPTAEILRRLHIVADAAGSPRRNDITRVKRRERCHIADEGFNRENQLAGVAVLPKLAVDQVRMRKG